MATPINHALEAINRLLTQYKSATNIKALIDAFMEQVQEVEDSLQTFPTARALATATGAQLDGIGEILDLERGTFDDAVYRIILYAKIAEYNSNGTINDIINMLILCSGCIDVTINEIGQATMMITINQSSNTLGLNDIVNNCKLAGVNFELIESYAEPFAFLEYTANNNTPKGFDDLTNPGDGGILSNVI